MERRSTFLNCRFSGGPAGLVRFARSGASHINCTFENTALRPDPRLLGHDQAPASRNFDNCPFSNIFSDQPIIQGAFGQFNRRGCTVVNCSAPSLFQCLGSSGATRVVVRNSIIWGNAFATLATLFDGTLDVAWSITQPPVPSPGDLPTDPLLANPGWGDYSLNRGSPGVDAGDSFAVPAAITTDILGNPRRVDDPHRPDAGIGAPVVDRGAYEHQLPGPGFCPADLTAGAIPARRAVASATASSTTSASSATCRSSRLVAEREGGVIRLAGLPAQPKHAPLERGVLGRLGLGGPL